MRRNILTGILAAGLGIASAFLPIKSKAETLRISYLSSNTNIVGTSYLDLEHDSGAQEGGPDGYDSFWEYETPPPFVNQWLKIATKPYTNELIIDARPISSETIYKCFLIPQDQNNLHGTTSNSLYFNFTKKDASYSNRMWTAHVHMDAADTVSGTNSDMYFQIPVNGTNTFLPNRNIIDQSTNSYVDISCRFLEKGINKKIEMDSPPKLEVMAQAGATVTPQASSDLVNWSNMVDRAIYISPDSNNFNSTPTPHTDANNSVTYSNAPSVTFTNLPIIDSNHTFYRAKISN